MVCLNSFGLLSCLKEVAYGFRQVSSAPQQVLDAADVVIATNDALLVGDLGQGFS